MTMRTRIDHTTIVRCRGSGVEVLEDGSIVFEGGVVRAVGPTSELSAEMPVGGGAPPPLAELVGRPLGAILVHSGRLSREQLNRALERQAHSHHVIGQTLLEMGFISEAEIEWALAVQAGRQPAVAAADTVVIDGTSYVVTPGLVNAHHHLFQSLTRCLGEVQTAPLFAWLTGLYARWRQVDEEALRLAATASLAELALSGCTTTSDQHYLFPAGGGVRIDAVLEAAEAVGLRIHAGRGCMTLGASAGGLPPDDCCESDEVVLADCGRVIDAYHDGRPHAMRRIDLAPCSPFNVSPALFDAVRGLARERGLLLHTHAAETLEEERFCLERFGLRPIAYLEQHGWLGRDVYLAHCVHVDESEIELLAGTGTAVVHCPSSNMRLGSGIAPIRRMLDAGVRVGVGVDGGSSNDGGNVLAEARQALLLQRVGGNPAGLTAGEAFRMVTAGGADVLHRAELGGIEVGGAADLAMFDRRDPAFAGSLVQDAVGALVLAHPPRPVHVFAAGRPIVQYGRLTRLDWGRLHAEFDRLVRERFGCETVAGAGPRV